jgi:hypothetical protein
MPNEIDCRGIERDSIVICEVHGVTLINKTAAEQKLQTKIIQPDGLFCPVTGRGPFSNETAAHDAIRRNRIKLP